MQLAMVAAGFTPGEADQLRRAMAAWKRKGGARAVRAAADRRHARARLRRGVRRADLPADPGLRRIRLSRSRTRRASRCSSTSRAWLKRHEPAAFCCALLNSQPMGFYAPAQLVQDARATASRCGRWTSTRARSNRRWSPCRRAAAALRLGLDRVRGLSRGRRPAHRRRPRRGALRAGPPNSRAAPGSSGATSRRSPRPARSRARRAPASRGLGRARHRAGRCRSLPAAEREEGLPLLRAPTEGEDIVADYRALGLTLGAASARAPAREARDRRLAHGGRGRRRSPDGAPVADRRHRRHAPAAGQRGRRRCS